MMFSFDKKIEDNADPKVQVAQVAGTERQRHQEIQRQAVAITGDHGQLEMRLRQLTSKHSKTTKNTRQIFASADQTHTEGDEATAQKVESTAEMFVAQLVNIEEELENTTQLHQQAVSAAEEAQRQAQQSQARYEQIKQDIRKLESQAGQVRIQETMPEILQSMQGISKDPNVLTLDSVHGKIEDRCTNVLGAQELAESSQTGRIVEIEISTRDAAANMCLTEIRAQMNSESAALESGSAARDNVSELESAESAESTETAEDTTADVGKAKQFSPVTNNRQ